MDVKRKRLALTAAISLGTIGFVEYIKPTEEQLIQRMNEEHRNRYLARREAIHESNQIYFRQLQELVSKNQ